MYKGQGQIDQATVQTLVDLWGPDVIKDIKSMYPDLSVKPMSGNTNKLLWYTPSGSISITTGNTAKGPSLNDCDVSYYDSMYEGEPEDDDEPGANLSDATHYKTSSSDPTGQFPSSNYICDCKIEESPAYVDPDNFTLRVRYRVNHTCGKTPDVWKLKDYVPRPAEKPEHQCTDGNWCPFCANNAYKKYDESIISELQQKEFKGIPSVDEVEIELPFLSDLFDDAEDIATDDNADVIVNVINRLDDESISSEIRRSLLREMPPTCRHMIARRRLRKWGNELRRLRERLQDLAAGDCYYNSIDAVYGPGYLHRRVEWTNRKIDRYKRRLSGLDAESELYTPCNSCFSCKANTIGTEEFLEKEVPVVVSTTVKGMKGEMFNLI